MEQAQPATVLSVTDFGAQAGGPDCAQAFAAAFEKAAELGGFVTVTMPKGEYHIYKDRCQARTLYASNTDSCKFPQKYVALLLEEQQNLTLDGQGSLLVLHGDVAALAIIRSKHITLRDFSWDFAVPTTSEMEVAATGEENGLYYTDFRVADCFPYTVAPNQKTVVWNGGKSPYTGQVYWERKGDANAWTDVALDVAEKTICRTPRAQGPFGGVKRIVERQTGLLRFYYAKERPLHVQGRVFELCPSKKRHPFGALVWESENVTAERLGVHYMCGFGWLTQMSRNVRFTGCTFLPREGSGKYTTSFADLIHVSGAGGRIEIEGCSFGYAHDDSINIHGTFTRVEKKLDARTLRLRYVHRQQGGFPQYHVGDQVAFYARNTLERLGGESAVYTVSRVENCGENGNSLKTMTVTFDRDLPKGIATRFSGKKYVAENLTYTPEVVIRSNTFDVIPTRQILCTTCKKAVIADNTFDHTAMAQIFLSNDSNQWYESGPIRDMTIQGNTFVLRPSAQREWGEKPAILIHPVVKGGKLPPASRPVHCNITIEDNTFYIGDDRAVTAECTRGLRIANNCFLPGEGMVGKKALYAFTNCSDVLAAGNTYDAGLCLAATQKGCMDISVDL